MSLDPNIPHGGITYKIIGAAIRVHDKIGPGYREKHYQRALTTEMQSVGLTVEEEKPVDLYVDDNWIGRLYMDHLVEGVVVVEIKAFSHLLTQEDEAQLVTYLAATDLKVGLLFNFGRRHLGRRRILPPRDVTRWPDHIQRFLRKPEE